MFGGWPPPPPIFTGHVSHYGGKCRPHMGRTKICRWESNEGCWGRGIFYEFVFQIILNVPLLLQLKKKVSKINSTLNLAGMNSFCWCDFSLDTPFYLLQERTILVLFLSLCFSYVHFRSILWEQEQLEPGHPCQRRSPGSPWVVRHGGHMLPSLSLDCVLPMYRWGNWG